MAKRTIRLLNGTTLSLSSEDLSPATLALAEVLVELAVEQGSPTVMVSEEEIMARLRAKGYVEVLDLLHAAGYLWKAVHLFHSPASPSAQALMKVCLLALLEGQVKKLMGWLSDQAEQVSLSAQAREQLASIGAYFHRHRHRVQYDQYLAKGYPIASGVIEGACRHVVKDRLERTGMNWTLPGAQAMLALRCVAINDQWEAFMTHRIEQETARLYPYASQNRPDPQPFLQAA